MSDNERLRRASSRLEADKQCKHGVDAASCEYGCNPGDPMLSITRDGRPYRQVIADFVAGKYADHAEEVRPAEGTHRKIPVSAIAKLSGAVIAGVAVAYCGGRVVLHIIRRRAHKNSSS